MAKGFSLILGTRDSENVLTTETVQVRVGSPHFDPPQVGFTFPPQIAPRPGEVTGPLWPVGEYWAFAFCRVVPTPSGENTGRFFVQYYYNSGNWPNDPARKFHQTFDGSATTINGNLFSYTTDELAINAGGGDPTVGFASANDVSGLRHALVITNADLSYVYEGQIGDRAFRTGGDRAGFRNPGTDELITAFKYDANQQKLFTLARLERASGLPTWVAGAQIIAHPYHYVPLYRNDGASSIPILPRVAVIEEGAQFPLTGLLSISGSAVTGQFTRFLSEVASGTQMALRFSGDNIWYIVSGVLTNSSIVVYDYGLNPLIYSGTAEAVPYALGSGIINVLPGLVGCADWDIVFTPDIRDGDGFTNLSSVTFQAAPVAIVPGGAPSGTLSYVWEVQPQGDAITTISNSGNQINVDFSNSEAIPIDVRVFVSGSGQPTCIHSDSTGYITLKKAVSAGTWLGRPFYEVTNGLFQETQSIHTWKIRGINADPLAYFHHQVYVFEPNQAFLNGSWTTTNSYISIKKGQIDTWPTAGTFVVAHQQFSDKVRLIYGIYSGKQTNVTDDRLTGLTIIGSFLLDKSYFISSLATGGAGIATVPDAEDVTFIYVPNIGSWPFAHVEAKVNSTLLKVQGANLFSARKNLQGIKVWFIKSGNPIHANTITSINLNDLGLLSVLPSWVDAGAICVLAPWDSALTGNQEPSVSNSYWNRGNMAFLHIPLLTGTAEIQLGVQSTIRNPGLLVDGITNFDLPIADNTKRNSTGTMGSFPQFTWLPPQGKIIVPNIDRSKTLVISYQSYISNSSNAYSQGNDCPVVVLKNCRVVQMNGTAASGFLQSPQLVVPFKEVKFDPVPFVITLSGTIPDLTVKHPGLGFGFLGFNATFVDVIKANLSSTNPSEPGSEGTPINQPAWEKAVMTNFPTNGIPAQDPIYRKLESITSSSTGGGGGGCLVGETLVTIKNIDQIPVEVPISTVKIGDQVWSLDRITYQPIWCTITDQRSLIVSEAFELITGKGKSIVVTETHPIATCNHLEWTPVSELEIGTWLETEDGPDILIKKIHHDWDTMTVYDITVDNLHSFIAGGILVHNKSRFDSTFGVQR